jgi:hypothetical protein
MILKTAPNDNWLIDTRNTEVKQQDELTKKVNRLTRVPRNSPAKESQKVTLQQDTFDPTGLFVPNDLTFSGNNKGFYFRSNHGPTGYELSLLQNPQDGFRMANINDVTLRIALGTAGDLSGFSTNSANDYSIDFYVSISAFEVENTQIIPNATQLPTETQFLCIKFEYTHLASQDPSVFTWDRSVVNLRLSDTIPLRSNLTKSAYPDFDNSNANANPEKITVEQLENLKTKDYFIWGEVGYDPVQYAALPTGDQAHFDPLFKTNRIVSLQCDAIFTYFGTAATYKLIN